jgi:hypothetical protein
VSVIAFTSPRPRLGRRSIAAIGGVAVAVALSVATFSNPELLGAVGDGVSDTIQGMKTVAAMLAERSPGERPDGALANLKPKRQIVLHERALPKVRGPATSPTPYEALIATPPNPVIAPPPEAPLYNVVAGLPPVIAPPTAGVTPGGPPLLTNIPPPGAGGGGIFSPPVTAAAPEVPVIPVTPVPEPATWAMMLIGFALIGRALRRRGAAILRPTTG